MTDETKQILINELRSELVNLEFQAAQSVRVNSAIGCCAKPVGVPLNMIGGYNPFYCPETAAHGMLRK